MTSLPTTRFIASLDEEEEIFCQGWAAERSDRGKKEKRISNQSPYALNLQAIVSEYLVARSLGMMCNPSTFRGGDGHRKDLWKGPVTVSLKVRGSHLPGDFLFVPSQAPSDFPDDYGIVGRWAGPSSHPYRDLELLGYFSYYDWEEYHETIILPVKNHPNGLPPERIGYREQYLRPIEELRYDIERVPDEAIRAVQDYGYKRYFGDWYRSGRMPVL